MFLRIVISRRAKLILTRPLAVLVACRYLFNITIIIAARRFRNAPKLFPTAGWMDGRRWGSSLAAVTSQSHSRAPTRTHRTASLKLSDNRITTSPGLSRLVSFSAPF